MHLVIHLQTPSQDAPLAVVMGRASQRARTPSLVVLPALLAARVIHQAQIPLLVEQLEL
jgi:spore maturation protein SpmA